MRRCEPEKSATRKIAHGSRYLLLKMTNSGNDIGLLTPWKWYDIIINFLLLNLHSESDSLELAI